MKFPNVVYLTHDDGLLAWPKLSDTEDGKVAVYILQEVFDKRDVAEIRKEGTRKWFKAAG